MKPLKSLGIAALLAVSFGSGTALADHGHGHWHGHDRASIGFYFGPSPFYYRPYVQPYYPYPYPYYAYPPVVISPPAPQSPPVYVEKGQESAAPDESTSTQDYYWYHCDKPEGYYPYIKECPGGWQKVTPEPPQQ